VAQENLVAPFAAPAKVAPRLILVLRLVSQDRLQLLKVSDQAHRLKLVVFRMGIL